MMKNWRFVQSRLYDPPTIHHASLSCKLPRAVKFKSIIQKIRFLQTAAFFCLNWLENQVLIKFYLLSAGKTADF